MPARKPDSQAAPSTLRSRASRARRADELRRAREEERRAREAAAEAVGAETSAAAHLSYALYLAVGRAAERGSKLAQELVSTDHPKGMPERTAMLMRLILWANTLGPEE